jgi:hypothetical protein
LAGTCRRSGSGRVHGDLEREGQNIRLGTF